MSGFPCSCKRRRGSLAGREHVVSARRFDEARAKGAKLLEQNEAKSIANAALTILLKGGTPAKPLK